MKLKQQTYFTKFDIYDGQFRHQFGNYLFYSFVFRGLDDHFEPLHLNPMVEWMWSSFIGKMKKELFK